METRADRKGIKKKKKWKRTLFWSLFSVVLVAGLGTYYFYSEIASAVNKMHKPISREVSEEREKKVEVKKQDPLSILLVGVDEREGDSGRTDSMLVITINPELKTTKIVSIPRDTRTKLINKEKPSKSRMDKINHAYAFGGIEMTINTVENFLNIPIDHFIEVNMAGFRDIVDAVGGIDVINEHSFELDGTYLSKGPHHLNGEEALQYARMRKEDPLGDFGRQARQREVISKVISKGASLSSITKSDEILLALENNIKTSLTLDEMISMQFDYKPAVANMEKIEIPGEGKTLDKWYHIVSDETRQSLSDELRTHLEVPTSPVSKIED
ncbi:LytR family transcriptional regulator [Bacillus sp. BGMRC 2118]|nr:LytR family transcriptional regulator [Bacillus sp. BGMRC 2118]